MLLYPLDFLGRGRNASSDQKTVAEASQKRKISRNEWKEQEGKLHKIAQSPSPTKLRLFQGTVPCDEGEALSLARNTYRVLVRAIAQLWVKELS